MYGRFKSSKGYATRRTAGIFSIVAVVIYVKWETNMCQRNQE